MDRHFFHTDNKDSILSMVSSISPSMVTYMREKIDVSYTLWYKDIKHADIISNGKSILTKYRIVKGKKVLKKRIDPEYGKNVLNYYTVKDMISLAKKSKKPYPTAKQSNIHVYEKFLSQLGVDKSFRGALTQYADFFLVNDTLSYFTEKYTIEVVKRLNKDLSKFTPQTPTLSDGNFSQIQLSLAAHGIGTTDDTVLHSLRHNVFTHDRIYFLVEESEKKKVFILLDKSPVFYGIIGMRNSAWVNYLTRSRAHDDANILANEPLSDTESRSLQKAWKDNLAREMMTQTDHENEVFCPLTRITADYDKVSTLFRASHIVRFADSQLEEKYDLYNGLLLCANADALFDKHLISINDNEQLVFSFLIDNNKLLKDRLLLNQGVYKDILKPERKKYLHKHYQLFLEKEEIRKKMPDSTNYELLED